MDSEIMNLSKKIILVLDYFTGRKTEELIKIIGEDVWREGRNLLSTVEEHWGEYSPAVDEIENNYPVSKNFLKKLETGLHKRLMELADEDGLIKTLEKSIEKLEPIIAFLEKKKRPNILTFQEPTRTEKINVHHEERSTSNIDEKKEEQFVIIGDYKIERKTKD